jgi:hypothetical protein
MSRATKFFFVEISSVGKKSNTIFICRNFGIRATMEAFVQLVMFFCYGKAKAFPLFPFILKKQDVPIDNSKLSSIGELIGLIRHLGSGAVYLQKKFNPIPKGNKYDNYKQKSIILYSIIVFFIQKLLNALTLKNITIANIVSKKILIGQNI